MVRIASLAGAMFLFCMGYVGFLVADNAPALVPMALSLMGGGCAWMAKLGVSGQL